MIDPIRDILTLNKLDKIDFAEAEIAINEIVKKARKDELYRATETHIATLGGSILFSTYLTKRIKELDNEKSM
mgnify:CR=1 FL=1